MKKMLVLLMMIAMLVTPCRAAFAEEAPAATGAYEALQKGSRGDAVKGLQERLKALGYYARSVDGDYGKGTDQAVRFFQSRNGLEEDGVASAALQELLFSEAARRAPIPPEVYPTKLRMNKKEGTCVIKNDSSETIDSVYALYIFRDKDGEFVCDQPIDDVYNYAANMWGIQGETIKAGRSGQRGVANKIESTFSLADVWGCGIYYYHTASGKNVYHEYNDVTFYYTDGTVAYPEGDGETYVITDEEWQEIAETRIGILCRPVYPWASAYFGLPAGQYVLQAEPDSPAEKAGIKAGDVITLIDGNDALLVKNMHDASRRLKNGETVEYTCYREGETLTVGVSLDAEALQAAADDGADQKGSDTDM